MPDGLFSSHAAPRLRPHAAPRPKPFAAPRPRLSPRLTLLLGAALLRAAVLAAAGTSLSLLLPLDHPLPAAFAESEHDGSEGGDGGGDGGDGGDGSGGSDGGSGSGSGSGGGGDGSGGDGSGGDDGGGGGGEGSGEGGEDGSGSDDSGSDDGGSGAKAADGAGTSGDGASNAEGSGSEFEAGEVVVVGEGPGTLAGAQSLGFRLIEERPLAALGLSVLKLKTPASLDERRAVALLHERFPRLIADVNSIYTPYKTQSAEVVSLPAPDYARRMIGWSGGEGCGAGFRIGMIDSAVAGNLPALAGRHLHQRSFVEPGMAAGDTTHGTAIAALLVGQAEPGHGEEGGLLPSADLYAASIFERRGERSEASALAIAAALDWMVQNHVPVVNLSLSGEANELMALAVRQAVGRGTVLVAAAGNGGPTAPPAFPGALPQVIAVTAVDQTGAVFAGANRGDYIAFAAPGVRIWAPGPDGAGHYQTGTSFAAPFAVGTVALELMRGAPPDPAALSRRLASHARALGPGGKNPIFGYGLIQATAACEGSASAD
jgi:hypothetical protein